MNKQQKGVSRRIPRELDQQSPRHRPGHLAHILRDNIQRHRIDHPLPSCDVENPCPPRGILHRFGDSLHKRRQENMPRLQIQQSVGRIKAEKRRPESAPRLQAPQAIQHQRQQPSGGSQVHRLRQQHHPLARKAVGDIPRQWRNERPRQVVKNPKQHQMGCRRISNLQDQQTESHQLVPAPELRQDAHAPNHPEIPLPHQPRPHAPNAPPRATILHQPSAAIFRHCRPQRREPPYSNPGIPPPLCGATN